MKRVVVICVGTILACCLSAKAECPLDHFIIGCNRDGIAGTPDDKTLFVDAWQKYRDTGETSYEDWFYPLQKSFFTTYPYRIGEPGFDMFQADDAGATYTYDPNRSLAGEPDVDYCVTVECVALSEGLRAVHKDYPQFTIDAVGESFDHSYIYTLRGDAHMHMSYQATDGESLQWITFRTYDRIKDDDQYEPSEPFTLVFNVEPLAGDLVVDGMVDIADMAELSHYWLATSSSRHNDFCERADANRDGLVDLRDFARMAANWSE